MRKLILGTGLLALLALALATAPQDRPRYLDPLVEATHVETMGTSDAADHPGVVLVEDLLGPILAASQDEAVVDAIGTLLEARFGGMLVVEATMLGYKTVWCPIEMEWRKICCNATTWRVDLPGAGSVRVEAEDRLLI